MIVMSVFGLPPAAVIFLLFLLALLLFGGSRLSGLGKSAGTAIREFKEETESLRKPSETAPAVEPAPVQPMPVQVAKPDIAELHAEMEQLKKQLSDMKQTQPPASS